MNVREFRQNLADSLNKVVDTGEPLPVDNSNRPHVVVVSAKRWEEIEEALTASEHRKQETSA